MEFEFDPSKSAANKAKHGIDFVSAQALWRDENMLEAPARTEDEPRFLTIGKIGGVVWSAIFTRRNGRIRIISVRRARKTEIEHYESA
ncbi:MAG: BrnT family toxin [Parvularculaceae bacterium]|nr:BrnT family toxin [Parvularculaceae bacterium]